MLSGRVESVICNTSTDVLSCDAVVISGLGEELYEWIKIWQKSGIKVLYSHTEGVWDSFDDSNIKFPYQREIFATVDYVICCSHELVNLTHMHICSEDVCNCVVIEDGTPM